MKRFNKVFTILVLIFLYVPMLVLAVASFNRGSDIATWSGFTFSQYGELFRDGTLLPLLANSLLLAVISAVVATVLGTMAAIGIHNMRGRLRTATIFVTNIPMTNPEIVTGVSLALLFAFAGTMLKRNDVFSFGTLLVAHVTFNLPYVILSVLPKLSQMEPDLQDAALDLGCTPLQAFFKVMIHEILPGVISGVIMVLIPSISTFYISQKLGNGKFYLIGDAIEGQYAANNLHFAAAIAFILMVILLVCMALMQRGANKKAMVV